MEQMCPDCKEKQLGSVNYCTKCQAKLPNAPKWMPDYKKIRTSPELVDKDEFMKLVRICLDSEYFTTKLLDKILVRAFKSKLLDPPPKEDFTDVILKMFVQELFAQCSPTKKKK
ncbi:MAG: hypothetical protein JXA08_04090 [Methanomicrobiaceae archaeon]|nr:hypothetical protein [Methanomicrobiaceae archaeon]